MSARGGRGARGAVRGRGGFTLIEVLLASALMATIGLAVAQIVTVMHRAELDVQRRAARRAQLGGIELRLHADLQAIVPSGGLYASGVTGATADRTGAEEDLVPPALRDAAASMAPYLDPPPLDARDTVTLAVVPPATTWGETGAAGTGPMWSVVYAMDDDPATPERGLVRRVTKVRDPIPGAEPEPVEVLAADAAGVRIRYWDGAAWQAVWDSGASDTLPRAIELRIALVRDGAVETLTTVVAPLTSRGADTATAAAKAAAEDSAADSTGTSGTAAGGGS